MRLNEAGAEEAPRSASFQLAGEDVSLCVAEATGVMEMAESEAVMASILARVVVNVENDEEKRL